MGNHAHRSGEKNGYFWKILENMKKEFKNFYLGDVQPEQFKSVMLEGLKLNMH